ncbi:hypothetical protein AGR7A_Lc10028 [Agrobacterium deltaense NCPPB 1641]|uniref:Uncharacterized protein n=1 Tax=Agrobacterium deltaense NCPPB 1641 TaxID=1183425 RepID=A0A1S7TRZ8_9HYPH|nr:hypothetical protein AGR7A_Lc10028 [Agrobacterium deltaense NCPPB 1641]
MLAMLMIFGQTYASAVTLEKICRMTNY